MKKLLLIILATVLLATLGACSIKNVTKYAYAGDDAFYAGEFNFFMAQAMNAAYQTAQSRGETLETAKDWKTVKIGDKTAEEYVKDEVSKTMKQYIVLMAKAKEFGEEFTNEDEEMLSRQRQSIIDSYGGRYSYEQYFSELGFTIKAVENIIRTEIFAQKAYAYFEDPSSQQEGGETEGEAAEDTAGKPNFYDQINPSDEEAAEKYKNDYIMAKHILIKPSAPEAADDEEVKSEEELDADAKKQAEDIISQLNEGADFDALMKEHSQDVDSEGNLNGASGYIFTKGDMVTEFEEAAYALNEGEYTREPVKSEFGYHIILRNALPTSGEEYDSTIERIKADLQTEKMDNLIDKWAEEIGFKLNEKSIKRAKLRMLAR